MGGERKPLKGRRRLLNALASLLLCVSLLALFSDRGGGASGLVRRQLGGEGGRVGRPLVVVFAHFFPPNADYGSDLRLLAFITAVVERGHSVYYAAPQAGRPEDAARLDALIGPGRTLLLAPPGGLEGQPFGLVPEPLPKRVDVLVVAVWFWFRPTVFAQFVPLFTSLYPRGKLLALSDDCHHARQALIHNQNSHTESKYVGRDAPSPLWLLDQERAYYTAADLVVLVSERDRAMCGRNISALQWKGRVVRTGPHFPPAVAPRRPADPAPAQPEEEARRQEVVFLGRADNPTNFVALQNFLTQVWPAIRAALPQLTLVIVGEACTPAEDCHWTRNTPYQDVPPQQAGIRIAGFVPQLGQALQGRLAMVMPIFWSTGVNTKFYRALEQGLPLLISPVCAKSLGVGEEEGRSLFVCGGLATCWVSRLRALAENSTLHAEMSAAAAALGERLYAADEERKDFDALLAEVESL